MKFTPQTNLGIAMCLLMVAVVGSTILLTSQLKLIDKRLELIDARVLHTIMLARVACVQDLIVQGVDVEQAKGVCQNVTAWGEKQ